MEIQGSQEIKLSTAALSTLLASRHPALDSIQVLPITCSAVLSARVKIVVLQSTFYLGKECLSSEKCTSSSQNRASDTAFHKLEVLGGTNKGGVQVKGKRLDVEEGIRTRARAKEQAEQWQYVSASTKIFCLLADTLLEAQEGAGAGEDDDSWQTDSQDGAESVRSHAKASDPLNALRVSGVDPSSYALDEDHETGTDLDPDVVGLNLTEHICLQFRHLAQVDQPLFQSYCHTLNSNQLQAVQACF